MKKVKNNKVTYLEIHRHKKIVIFQQKLLNLSKVKIMFFQKKERQKIKNTKIINYPHIQQIIIQKIKHHRRILMMMMMMMMMW
jgi:hypothetical protein